MLQVKAFNTLGDYRSLCHHFTRLARLMKLDTLLYLLYYELLMVLHNHHTQKAKITVASYNAEQDHPKILAMTNQIDF